MKKTLLFTICFVSILLFSSCEKETILTVNQASLSFNNSGGSQTVNIVANKVWSASSNQSWCKVSPSSGDGSDNSNITLSLSCDANTTYDARTCTITITCEELTKTISVSQAEGDGLVVSQTEYSISNQEQLITLSVQSNVDYTVISRIPWITSLHSKGLSNSSVTLSVAENDGNYRFGKVSIIGRGIEVVVTIEQEAAEFVEFSDDGFKSYCLEMFDRNGDGHISIPEAKFVDEIYLFGIEGIEDLSDLHFFPNLLKLYCSDCHLKILDVSKNKALTFLSCGGNGLKSLDVTQNTYLTTLDCGRNLLSYLDLSKNIELQTLKCINSKLTNLDLSKNINLQILECGYNQLSSLNLSNNTKIEYIECSKNQLSELTIGGCSALISISCYDNLLNNLDVSTNISLSWLNCSDNLLNSLDVSNNSNLESLLCYGNPLTEIWLKTGQVIEDFQYDAYVSTIKYK